MKFRKFGLFLLIGLLVVGLTITGCGNSDVEKDGSKGEKPKEFFIKIATGNTGGTYYPVGVAMGQLFSKKIPGCTSSAMSTGGSVDNVNLLRSGEVQVGMMMSTVGNWAYFGENKFADKKYDDLRAITSLWSNKLQVVVHKDIKSFADLKGKRFVVGAVASGTETDSHAVLAQFGLYYRDEYGDKKNITPVYLNYAEGVEALKNRQVAGMLNTSNPPASSVTDLMATGDFHILSFTDGQIEKLSEANPLYAGYKIKADTYPNQKEEIQVPGYPVLFVTNAKVPEDDIYKITKAMFENVDELISAHKAAEAIQLESATKGVRVPFHAGAKKYLEEKGAWNK